MGFHGCPWFCFMSGTETNLQFCVKPTLPLKHNKIAKVYIYLFIYLYIYIGSVTSREKNTHGLSHIPSQHTYSAFLTSFD